MDKEVLETKLAALVRCVHRIKSQNVSSAQELEQNLDKQEIIVLNLQRAVQICVEIGNHLLLDCAAETPATMAETFSLLARHSILTEQNARNLGRAVGFRNIAVHQYENLDCNIIYNIVSGRLDDFKEFAASVEKTTR